MNKNDYMKTLAYNLRRLPKKDFDQAIDYYEEYFADAGSENEQKAIEDLGSPESAAKELIMNLAVKNVEEPPKTVKHSFKAIWIGILGICAAPIALPIALCLILIIASLIFSLLCILGGLLLTAICIAAAAIVGIIGGFILLFTSFANGLATLGFSFLCAGIGILSTCGIFFLCKWLLQKIVQLLGKITKGGRRNEASN